MKYALALSGALLAAAHPHQNAHGHHHKRDDVVVVTDVELVTETVYVTAGAPAPSPSPEAESSSAPAAAAAYVAPSSATGGYIAASPSAYNPPAWSPESSSSWSAPSSSEAAPAPTTTSWSSSEAPSSTWVAPSSSSSSSAPVSSSAPSSGSGISKGNLTPNGKKRGLSGYIGVQDTNAFKAWAPYLSWYSDYTPSPPDAEGLMGVGMLWGADGSPCSDVVPDRLATFNKMASAGTTPSIMFGFYEPDCTCDMSSDMSTSDAATQWDALIAPLASKGTILGSPSMCKQKDEDFLTPFKSAISGDWDVTSVHINKPSIDKVKEVVEYYVEKYNKPVWVSEFACVNDQPSWSPCTDQTQINQFISDCVTYFEGNENVVAYGPSNGAGLGDVWPLTNSNTGELTTSGQAYLDAIKSL